MRDWPGRIAYHKDVVECLNRMIGTPGDPQAPHGLGGSVRNVRSSFVVTFRADGSLHPTRNSTKLIANLAVVIKAAGEWVQPAMREAVERLECESATDKQSIAGMEETLVHALSLVTGYTIAPKGVTELGAPLAGLIASDINPAGAIEVRTSDGLDLCMPVLQLFEAACRTWWSPRAATTEHPRDEAETQ